MSDDNKKLTQKISGADIAPVFYANHVNALVTQFDMRLRFAQIEDVNNEMVSMREVVTVYLSPKQALALRNMLNKRWDVYEKIWAAGTGDGEA